MVKCHSCHPTGRPCGDLAIAKDRLGVRRAEGLLLSGNTPNRFNPSTSIAYDVQQQAHITLTGYNLLGQEVLRLVDGVRQAGRYTVQLNNRNAANAPVSRGVHL